MPAVTDDVCPTRAEVARRKTPEHCVIAHCVHACEHRHSGSSVVIEDTACIADHVGPGAGSETTEGLVVSVLVKLSDGARTVVLAVIHNFFLRRWRRFIEIFPPDSELRVCIARRAHLDFDARVPAPQPSQWGWNDFTFQKEQIPHRPRESLHTIP